jgi:hypothetical protein
MVAPRRSAASVNVTDSARRYFQQFLGESSAVTPEESDLFRSIEGRTKEDLVEIGERAFSGLREHWESNTPGDTDTGTALLAEGGPTLSLKGLRTTLFVVLVNVVADDLEIEGPEQVRQERQVSIGDTLPGIYHDHLILCGRFSMDALQTPRPKETFAGVLEEVVDRLGSLVELASQAMMGGDVDPFETMEHEDCEKCGHLLQRHVGFESWAEVRGEHNRWCPGSKSG